MVGLKATGFGNVLAGRTFSMQEDSGPVPSTERSRPGPGGGITQRSSAPPSNNGASDFLLSPPAVSLPKGGGAVRGIGEKFSANPVTGTGAMSIPIALSPGRGGFGPQLALNYDSGAAQSVFGLGWNLALPSIVRKTDKGLPRYLDAEESDVFLLSGAEDLVPFIDPATGNRAVLQIRLEGIQYNVHRYRPRIEGLFARIERWSAVLSTGATFWRTISRDNVTTWYGRNQKSQIFDPSDPSRIFQWLICQTNDDKGNVAVFDYLDDRNLAIDTSAVWEVNRDPKAREANRYLKRIRYGNPPPSYLPMLDPDVPDELPTKWMFEAVFDYGDHAGDFPTPAPDAPPTTIPRRPDAFSSHRAGFEIRTYRLCRRVLMFHHFLGVAEVGQDCLVRSTEFEHELADATADPSKRGYSVLRSATQWSYQAKPDPAATPGSSKQYEKRQLPPVVFKYSEPIVNTIVKTLDASALENLPVGTQGPGYRWIDLDGEGLSGVLAEASGAWYYKPGLGDGKFGPIRAVAQLPAMALAAGSRHQFMDLAGDGAVDVVDFSGPTPGFHERDADQGWKRLVPFASLPNVDWQDPNLRFLDLTGDGHADALVTEQDVFTWYPSLDERGFDAAERTRLPAGEDAGPRLVFAEETQTIFLADMGGDGLTDLVRIRNGEVCYWPNLGYGRFGRKVTLGNAPRFDAPDLFDPSRIRLADIDGSGPIDLIYLGRQGAQLYFNRSGNSLSDAQKIALPLVTENVGAVQVADLLGNGTACLVWNSHLPADSRRPVCYIDLMGGSTPAGETEAEHRRHEKPHLLIRVDNNLGATTDIEYTPSTRFYLKDREAGMPWTTRLPFPVHCVSKVTLRDKWRGTAFSSTYSYHHGQFDGVEREFRGFGRLEQVDTQAFSQVAAANAGSPFVTADLSLYQPPVKTITWFHTGIAHDRSRILGLYAQEYLPARCAAQFAAAGYAEPALPHPVVDPGWGGELSADEWREAMRACKGMPLRQEVYELDFNLLQATGAHVPVRIFSAAGHGCRIARLQPRGGNRHSVFHIVESESFTCNYEMDLRPQALAIDPRIAQAFNLRFDRYGRALQSVAVAYPRRLPFADAALGDEQVALINRVQQERHIAYTESDFTSELAPDAHSHRPPLPCEVRTYELSGDAAAMGFVPVGTYFAAADFLAFALSDSLTGQGNRPVAETAYHLQPADASAHRRLVEHARTLYFDAGPAVASPVRSLPFGTHDARGLKYEDYKLALTDALLAAVFEDRLQSGVDTALTAAGLLANPARSGYVPGTQVAPSLAGQYWMRSGVAGFSADARDRFYLPTRYVDPFGNATTLQYDGELLFVRQTTDALGNTAEVARFDYRVLAAARLRDANHNESAVAFDVHGLPVASALLGKVTPATTNAPETTQTGDTLAGFGLPELNPSEATVSAFFGKQGLDGREREWLGKATARFVYHFGELRDNAGQVIRWADKPAAACSLLRERHEPDPADPAAPPTPLQVALEYSDGAGQAFVKKVQAEPELPNGPLRWITNGKTVVNNKGKPVLQYEPYFSKDENDLPDRRFQEPKAQGVSPVMFYDASGRLVRTEFPDGTLARVAFSPWFNRSYDPNDTVLDAGNRWYAERTAAGASAENRRAAALAALHADTPAETHFDSLGRAVVAIAHNRSPDSANSNTPLPQRAWDHARYLTFTRLDAEGKPLWIKDARGNLVMQYVRRDAPNPAAGKTVNQVEPDTYVPCYDIAGNLLFQHSMDAGDRWMLMDAAGKPMLAWDRNEIPSGTGPVMQNRLFHTRYDALHRPTELWLLTSDGQGQVTGRFRIEAFEYLDTGTATPGELDEARRRNLIGQAVWHWDASGLTGLESIDVSGQPDHQTRALARVDPARDGDTALHWPDANPDRLGLLDAEVFHRITDHDALGRMVRLFNWHRDVTFNADGSQQNTPGATNRVGVYVPRYDERGALAGEWIYLRASKSTTAAGQVQADLTNAGSAEAIQALTRDAKGQKLTLELGNGSVTTYDYDKATFRLLTLKTRRSAAPSGVQDLRYTYDAVGNITTLQDAAQETVWSNNARIDATQAYTYDAIYRLIEATGRENNAAPAPPRRTEGLWPQANFPTAHVPRNYTQRYVYDEVDNFFEMRHVADNGVQWTRHYETQADSNRLAQTWYGGNTRDAVAYQHDLHGSMLNLNRLDLTSPADPDDDEDWGRRIEWEWRDMIHRFDAIGGGMARYAYGSDKQRTRKHITRVGGTVEDRLYLDGLELYRRRNAQGEVVEEIESQHLFEGEQRVLLVDDVISTDRTHSDGTPYRTQPIPRYQYSNHLGSMALELDEAAQIISYEEFHLYGSSAFRLMQTDTEASAKRYRYSGMERDEESGLAYHGARFLMCSLARWLSADPAGINSGINLFCYCRCRPSNRIDKDGKQDKSVAEQIWNDFKKGSNTLYAGLDYVADKAGEIPLKVQDINESLWGTNALTPLSRSAAGIQGAAISTGVKFVGGLILLGPGLLLLPGAIGEVPEQLGHGASEMKDGIETGNSERALMGAAEVSGAVGTVASAFALVAGGAKGARSFVSSVGDVAADGVKRGVADYAAEVTRQEARTPPNPPPPAPATLGSVPTPKLLGTTRDRLLNRVTSPALRNAIEQLYRAGAEIGDGSTGAVLRYEIDTGNLQSKLGHLEKAQLMRAHLQDLVRSGQLAEADIALAREALANVQDALTHDGPYRGNLATDRNPNKKLIVTPDKSLGPQRGIDTPWWPREP